MSGCSPKIISLPYPWYNKEKQDESINFYCHFTKKERRSWMRVTGAKGGALCDKHRAMHKTLMENLKLVMYLFHTNPKNPFLSGNRLPIKTPYRKV